MSDFGYWSWPLDLVGGYEQIRREISEVEIDFTSKKKQVVWRGAVSNNKNLRGRLVKVTEDKSWADVRDIEWQNATAVTVQDFAMQISMPEHCGYQFVIQTEGWPPLLVFRDTDQK